MNNMTMEEQHFEDAWFAFPFQNGDFALVMLESGGVVFHSFEKTVVEIHKKQIAEVF